MFLSTIYGGFKPLEKTFHCTLESRASTEFFGKAILPDTTYKVFGAESLVARQGDGLNFLRLEFLVMFCYRQFVIVGISR